MGHTVILEEDLYKTDIGDIIQKAPRPSNYGSETGIAPLLAVFKE